MNNQLERTSVAESNSREVTHVACCQTMDAEHLGERHDRTIHQAEAEIGETPVHFHGSCELTGGWRRVREGAASEILHERLHRPALFAKEIVDLGEHEARDVPGPCPVNGVPKLLVVRRALDQIVDERSCVANERSRATGRH